MSLVPTLYSSLPPELRNLFNEIICAPGQSEMAKILREAINVLNPDNAPVMTRDAFINSNANGEAASTQYSNDNLFLGACYDFVNYQINDERTCDKDYNLFMSEGFQIGSPWHGDIIQAPVMFLSVNPAITQNCIFPRWHSEDDSFTFAGKKASTGKKDYSIIYNRMKANNILNAPEDIYNFLRDRLRTAQTKATGSSVFWTANLPAKTTATSHDQQFWRCVLRNIMNAFHPNTLGINEQQHTQRLMNAVLSTEIIFWGTATIGKLATTAGHATLQYFWNKFTTAMIKNSGAELIFIVGKNTLDAFNAVYGGPVLNFGDILAFTAPSGRTYQLAASKTNGGGLGAAFIDDVVGRLTGVIPDSNRNPELMQNVIDKINALY